MLYTFLISYIFQSPLKDFKNILHPKGLEKGHNGNKPNLSARNNGYQHREKPFSPLPGFVSYHKSLSELFICDPLRISGNKVNAHTRHVITRSHANSITHRADMHLKIIDFGQRVGSHFLYLASAVQL